MLRAEPKQGRVLKNISFAVQREFLNDLVKFTTGNS